MPKLTQWSLPFITEEQLSKHVKATIEKYGEKLAPFNLKRFNKNIIDPIKLVFDKTVYQSSWETIINNELFRQRDKSNNNDIGYFHQKIFQYIAECEVPTAGWDIIYSPKDGITLPDGAKVKTAYIEMKNKHNTMNSTSSAKTFMKMQNQLLQDDNCACFLVEAIASKSQNIVWAPSVDGKAMQHKLIRRISIDQFYSIVTKFDDAFYQLCMELPSIIQNTIDNTPKIKIKKDTVVQELQDISKEKNISYEMAIYLLGFSPYIGFPKT